MSKDNQEQKQQILFSMPSDDARSTTIHPPQLKETWHIFVDGASRGNPGPSGAGVHIKQGNGKTIDYGWYLGRKTNNQAEYLALVLASFYACKATEKLSHKPKLIITSDSELLIKQMRGLYRIKNPVLAQFHGVIKVLLKDFSHNFKHVLRTKNIEADKLANQGIDTKRKVPVEFLAFLKDHDISI